MTSMPSRTATALWAAAGFATSMYYFTWLLAPGRAGAVALFALLVGADLFNGFHAFSFWLTCLRRVRPRPFQLPDPPTVDVLVPTYNEPVEVVEATVRAAARLRGARVRVLVLDDGDRIEMACMAAQAGATYIAREQHTGAKSGNINHALRATAAGGGEFICVFDSDHVAKPEFLERTLGYFTDAAVGLVQTPQIYANDDAGPLTRGAAEQQAIFFGPICSGRDGYRSTFCCGTNFVARREALERAGGFPEDSITEDIVLSTILVGLEYELVYVPEALSEGLGPEDARSYVSQQMRWATGCIELLLRKRSLWRPLSWTQRWQYFTATSYWFTGWTLAIYLSLPIVRLLGGGQPVEASELEFVAHFLPYFLLSIVNLGRFTNGGYGFAGLGMNWGSFAIHIRATLRVLSGRPGGFVVTSKRAVSGLPWMALVPNLGAVGAVLGAIAYAFSGGVTPAAINNAAFAILNAALVGIVVVFAVRQARIVERREAREGGEPSIAPALAVALAGADSGSEHG
jgi:cellulose synthase (UDP-forming)